MSYTLKDVVEWNRHFPSFEIPQRSAREGCHPGDLVKLVFLPNDGSRPERMWVKIIRVNGEGYVGELTNTPLNRELATRGDIVTFAAHHICSIELRSV